VRAPASMTNPTLQSQHGTWTCDVGVPLLGNSHCLDKVCLGE